MNKVLEVDIDSFNSNIDIIQKYSNKIVMPVIKANGYGTYINKNIDVLDRFDIVAVALVDEAIELIKKNSRNFAKRQYTFFNHQMKVNWFNVGCECC